MYISSDRPGGNKILPETQSLYYDSVLKSYFQSNILRLVFNIKTYRQSKYTRQLKIIFNFIPLKTIPLNKTIVNITSCKSNDDNSIAQWNIKREIQMALLPLCTSSIHKVPKNRQFVPYRTDAVESKRYRYHSQ